MNWYLIEMISGQKIIFLGGPTASGKSALALKWAEDFNGEIVNGDSMQIYKELDILTACPSPVELKQTPHHLYRVLDGNDPCSAERWRDMAREKINEIINRKKTPILVGGTGLYFKALVYGLSVVPEIDENIRKETRQFVLNEGAVEAHQKLDSLDSEMAKQLNENDSQRIARALEVVLSTGKSLKYWQSLPLTGGLVEEDVNLELNILERDRSDLYERCNLRFRLMIEEGSAIEEVEKLMTLNYDLNLPVMKSLGVPQIIDYLDDKITLEEAIILSQTVTRQFAKRQMTWFRNQFSDWNMIKL